MEILIGYPIASETWAAQNLLLYGVTTCHSRWWFAVVQALPCDLYLFWKLHPESFPA